MQRKVVNIVKEKKKLEIRVKILVEHKDWERAIESLEKLKKIYKSLDISFKDLEYYNIYKHALNEKQLKERTQSEKIDSFEEFSIIKAEENI